MPVLKMGKGQLSCPKFCLGNIGIQYPRNRNSLRENISNKIIVAVISRERQKGENCFEHISLVSEVILYLICLSLENGEVASVKYEYGEHIFFILIIVWGTGLYFFSSNLNHLNELRRWKWICTKLNDPLMVYTG